MDGTTHDFGSPASPAAGINGERLWTPKQLAVTLGVKEGTVYSWISRGQLSAYRYQRSRYISSVHLSDFVAYRERNTRTAPIRVLAPVPVREFAVSDIRNWRAP